MAGLNVDWRVCAMVQELRKDVGFIKFLVIHEDFAAFDFNHIAGHADDALDIGLRWIERIPENNNVPTLNLFNPVNEFVDEDPFLVDELRQHARTFDLNRLIQENDDENRRSDRKKYI